MLKAADQPDKHDMAVLSQGIPRNHVISELGAPIWTEEKDGLLTDVYSFKQGYSRETKALRALVHGAADVATFGLWEVIGVPIETYASGTDVRLEVRYDAQRSVQSVVVYQGEKVVQQRSFFAAKTKPATIDETKSVADRPLPDTAVK